MSGTTTTTTAAAAAAAARAAARGAMLLSSRGYRPLSWPESFAREAARAVSRCEELARSVRSQTASLERTVLLMDEISDTICGVADRAELARNAHADESVRRDAEGAYISLSGYANGLNADRGMYAALAARIDAHDAAGAGAGAEDEEVLACARRLREDFERGGVHMDCGAARRRLAETATRCTELGIAFGRNINDEGQCGEAECSTPRLLGSGLSGAALQAIDGLGARRRGSTRFAVNAGVKSSVLHSCRDGGIRREVFRAYYGSPAANLRVLDDLLEARYELSQSLGYESFSAYATAHTLAGSPAAVDAFLRGVHARLRPRLEEDLSLLARLKGGGGAPLREWDCDYYIGEAKRRHWNVEGIAQYLPVEGTVRRAVAAVCRSLGCRCVEAEVSPSEAWAPGLVKMQVFDAGADSGDGPLGDLFLDLRARPGKAQDAALYTLRCGRRLADGSYQAPVVALLCSFHPQSRVLSVRAAHA